MAIWKEKIKNLPKPQLWPTHTQAIVGSILLAVGFSANMQITERIDTATVGGIIPWAGMLFIGIWFDTACIWYGLTGALIVSSFNPIIAILTATGPLAPVHFTINWSYCIPFALMMNRVLRDKQELGWWPYLGMVTIAESLVATGLIPVWLYLFKFSAKMTTGLWIWAVLMAIPHAIIGFYFIRYVARSGILSGR